MFKQFQILDQLWRVNEYACARKESSKAGSVLILRFFLGEQVEARDFRAHTALARIKDGVTIEQTRAEIGALGAQLECEFPATNDGVQLRLTPLRDAETGNIRPFLLLLVGAVSLVLLI